MIQKSLFKPSWLLANAHLQTIWQTFFRRQSEVVTQRERLFLPDGDFVDLDWSGFEGGPIVLVLHGVAGSVESPYAKGLLRVVTENNWCGIFMHFRGCSGEPNRLPRAYHFGETGDLNLVVKELQKRYPNKPIAAVGFSMGGNVLLKWLGETGDSNPLTGAVAISVPFELEKSAQHINRGVARIYQWWILRDLRQLMLKKLKTNKAASLPANEIEDISSLWDFDSKVTAPLHGFTDAKDYYTKSSVRPYLKKITKPTLLLLSNDDPFMSNESMHANLDELSTAITLEISETGGHVGFVSGTPWNPKYWLEERIPEFLRDIFVKK